MKRGTICALRRPKGAHRLSDGGGRFPVTLAWKGAVGIPDAWWADDVDGRRYWWLESDLIEIGFGPDFTG